MLRLNANLRAAGAVALVLVACHPQQFRIDIPRGLDHFASVPDDHPMSRHRVALGRSLFFDPILSADSSRSCSSCHLPDRMFSDTAALSSGVFGRVGKRNTPSLLNAAYRSNFFWDGRSSSLEEQVLQPIQDSLELNLPLTTLTARLRATAKYRREFLRAFGAEASPQTVAQSLASFVRTLRSGDSAFDRYIGGDAGALSREARRGYELFVGRAQCATCHGGTQFSDSEFHNTGVAFRAQIPVDSGRARVTGRAEDVGKFRTPSLRNAALTAPYMHDGSIASLVDVIEFYDRGGNRNTTAASPLIPLGLSSQDKSALLAFLHALTSAP